MKHIPLSALCLLATSPGLAQDDARLARDDARPARDDARLARDDARLARDDARPARDDARLARDDARLALSRGAAAQLGRELSATLLAALGSGGPGDAIGICSIEASPVAARLSAQAGADIGRTALRIRNPENAPDAGAREVLAAFERELAAGAAPPEHFETRPDGSARYMSAIVTQPLCLACHGADLAPDAAAAIVERYPEDQATGFAPGDLRGAFIVDWPGAAAGPATGSPRAR